MCSCLPFNCSVPPSRLNLDQLFLFAISNCYPAWHVFFYMATFRGDTLHKLVGFAEHCGRRRAHPCCTQSQ